MAGKPDVFVFDNNESSKWSSDEEEEEEDAGVIMDNDSVKVHDTLKPRSDAEVNDYIASVPVGAIMDVRMLEPSRPPPGPERFAIPAMVLPRIRPLFANVYATVNGNASDIRRYSDGGIRLESNGKLRAPDSVELCRYLTSKWKDSGLPDIYKANWHGMGQSNQGEYGTVKLKNRVI